MRSDRSDLSLRAGMVTRHLDPSRTVITAVRDRDPEMRGTGDPGNTANRHQRQSSLLNARNWGVQVIDISNP